METINPLEALLEGFNEEQPIIDAEIVPPDAPEELDPIDLIDERTGLTQRQKNAIEGLSIAYNKADQLGVAERWVKNIFIPHREILVKQLLGLMK